MDEKEPPQLQSTGPSSIDISQLQDELRVFDRIPLSFWMALGKEYDYRIVYWNEGAEKNYGIPREEALGKSYVELFVEEGVVAEQSKKDCDRVIEGSFEHPRNCLAIDENKSEHRKIIVLTNVFRYMHNEISYQAEISVDLTRSSFFEFIDDEYMEFREGPEHETARTLEAFVDYMKNKIERNLRLWSRTFAHEMRSELVAIKNAQEEIASLVPEVKNLSAFKQIERAHKALYLQSQNFLNAQHLGRHETRAEAHFSLHTELHDIVAEYRDWAEMLSIHLRISGPELPEDLQLKGTPDAFVHVLRNLLANAIRHSGKNVKEENDEIRGSLEVSVSYEVDESSLKVTIVNLAQMMPDELVNKFKPFYKRPKSPDEGLHLGLSIANQWLESVGGALEIANLDGLHVIASFVWPRYIQSKSI